MYWSSWYTEEKLHSWLHGLSRFGLDKTVGMNRMGPNVLLDKKSTWMKSIDCTRLYWTKCPEIVQAIFTSQELKLYKEFILHLIQNQSYFGTFISGKSLCMKSVISCSPPGLA